MPKTIVEIFNDEQKLSKTAYFEYSQQFLSAEEIKKISSITDPQEQNNLRAKFLCESAKDPFSPPLNSFSQSKQLHIDTERVMNCFMRAYELYKQVTQKSKKELEQACLYKLGWAKEKTTPIFERLIEIWNIIRSLNQEEEFNQLIQQPANKEPDPLINKALSNHKDSIIKALGSKSLVAKNNALKPILAGIKKYITELVGLQFFKSSKNYKQLQAVGSVYDPGDIGGKTTHSWGTNLAWTLAHVRQGNTFVVCSDILQNKYRGSYDDTPCAFARELCVVLKSGYTLHVDSLNQITLCPDGLTEEHLKQLDSTGELGNGINPSFAEVDYIFNELKYKFRNISLPFTYNYVAPQSLVLKSIDEVKSQSYESFESSKSLLSRELIEDNFIPPTKKPKKEDVTVHETSTSNSSSLNICNKPKGPR